jgi:ActR/RegA family two-component response regulator
MPDPPGPRTPLTGWRILVVEDDWFIAQDLQDQLEALGAEVVGPAPSVARALALIAGRSAPLDAAMVDINLGGESAFPVADTLLDLGVRLVLTTGYDADAIPEAYEAVPRCAKPVDLHQCLALLSG